MRGIARAPGRGGTQDAGDGDGDTLAGFVGQRVSRTNATRLDTALPTH